MLTPEAAVRSGTAAVARGRAALDFLAGLGEMLFNVRFDKPFPMIMSADQERWAEALAVERQHGESAVAFIAERIGALAMAGDMGA